VYQFLYILLIPKTPKPLAKYLDILNKEKINMGQAVACCDNTDTTTREAPKVVYESAKTRFSERKKKRRETCRH